MTAGSARCKGVAHVQKENDSNQSRVAINVISNAIGLHQLRTERILQR